MTKTSPTSADTADLPSGPGGTFTFIYYFSGAALITALFTVKTLGVGLSTGLPGEFALVGGLIAGTAGVFFNRTQTVEIPFQRRKLFKQQLASVMADLGYVCKDSENGIDCYQRSSLQRWFAGDIYVRVQEQSALFVSRAANIRTLKKRLDG